MNLKIGGNLAPAFNINQICHQQHLNNQKEFGKQLMYRKDQAPYYLSLVKTLNEIEPIFVKQNNKVNLILYKHFYQLDHLKVQVDPYKTIKEVKVVFNDTE